MTKLERQLEFPFMNDVRREESLEKELTFTYAGLGVIGAIGTYLLLNQPSEQLSMIGKNLRYLIDYLF